MSFLDRLRALLGGGTSRDDEEAEREEFATPDRGASDLGAVDRSSRFAGSEAAETAEDDLGSFAPPRDPSP